MRCPKCNKTDVRDCLTIGNQRVYECFDCSYLFTKSQTDENKKLIKELKTAIVFFTRNRQQMSAQKEMELAVEINHWLIQLNKLLSKKEKINDRKYSK